ncbi:7a72e507-50c8-4465-b5fe-c7567cae5430 [Sclerotinia trifoliorum]|uniref:7a72e507-50c8-4465-b5fe-c7567cae5430 n=1 Tax=Sclerotinia trifoliorum TaxID=28548 RepID=A0A8H2ZN95_9HELO|nr:7a72e507-50c8-4465-b5fe-c7567cae5430 [Sclerotinia trifoliorum]
MDSSLSILYDIYDPYEPNGLLISEEIFANGQTDDRVVCEMIGNLVYRVNAVRSGFEKTMDHICTETSILLTSMLFDEQAKLRQTWISGARSGSQIWDSRLDEGDFLMIENVEVIKAYRRRGFGTSMVSQLLQQLKTRNIQWVFTHWGYENDKEIEMVSEEKEGVIAFWKALGFRRIGLSHLFCYAMADDDISRKLAIEDDNFSSENSYSTEYDSTRISSVESQEIPSEFKRENSPQLESDQILPMDIDSLSDPDGREARKDSKLNPEVGNLSENLDSLPEENQEVVGVFTWDW